MILSGDIVAGSAEFRFVKFPSIRERNFLSFFTYSSTTEGSAAVWGGGAAAAYEGVGVS